MIYDLNFKNNKLLFTLILMSFCGLACAQVPDYDGVGPQDGDVIHIQDGDEVFIASSRGIWPDCRLDSIDHFPGIHILYTHGWGCIGNTGIFTCDAGEGSFYGSSSSDIHGGICSGPERNFDIDNETGYSIKSIYFDANSYRTDSHSPDRSTWLAWQTATPGKTRSTDFGGGRLGVDTDYGHLDGNGIVGTLTIQSNDFKDPDVKSVAQAAVVQSNYNNPDGKYLLTSSVTINNPGPHPVATPIACAIPPANGQFSTDKDSPGKSVLLPSIMEAKLHLCVIAPITSNQYHFYNIAGLYTNLDTADTKLYPKILDSTYETNFESGYLSESLIYSDTGGRQCSQYDFVVKTKASNCLDLQNNTGSINSANILVAAYDTTGVSPSFTLSFNSDVTVSGDSVKAIYKLHLLNNTSIYGTVYNLVNGGTDNTITCDHGICNGEIDYHPPH